MRGQEQKRTRTGWYGAMVLAGCALMGAFVPAGGQMRQLPMEPPHDSGESVTGAFEGWYQNADGSYNILAGYFNRNLKQALDIPIGPDNKIEPGGPDQGQPTHFIPGRMWGSFIIKVPKDFGDKKLTWTLVANGKTTVIPLHIGTLWEVSPFIEASGNTPPFISFSASGEPALQGPTPLLTELSTTASNPLTLIAWVADDMKTGAGTGNGARRKGSPVNVAWDKFRGPGSVTFANEHPPVELVDWKTPKDVPFKGKAATTASFSQPGEYVLHITVNDMSGVGGAGFQCCWTNGHVKVTVKP